MKQRSASLDHSSHAHRRHRATVIIRTPYVKMYSLKKCLLIEFSFRESDDDDHNGTSTLPTPLIDLNKINIKRNNKQVNIQKFLSLNLLFLQFSYSTIILHVCKIQNLLSEFRYFIQVYDD